MADDPAFLFYAGDYLRDTQCLSEAAQVAYDRIMCEHMRKICISQSRFDFFTKRLEEEDKEMLKEVLVFENDGWHIAWVAASINKRREYSASRRKNRSGNNKKDMIDISNTYLIDMENENEIVNENINTKKNKDENSNILKHKHYENVLKSYEQAFSDLFGRVPTLGQFDDRVINGIAFRVEETMRGQGVPVTYDTIQQFSKVLFIKAGEDKWLREHYTPGNIEKQLEAIINKIKKGYEQSRGIIPAPSFAK